MLPELLKAVLVCAIGFVITGCASVGKDFDARISTPSRGAVAPVTGAVNAEAPLGLADEPDPDAARLEPTVIKGIDRMFNPPLVRPGVTVTGEAVTLRFEQVPVTDVVHAILGDVLGLPYVINPPVSGSLTIHASDPLPRDQVLAVLESVLQANGLSMVVDHAGVYHVGHLETLRGVAPSLGNLGRALPPGHNLLIVPLRFVGAAEMADILRPLATPETFVRIDGVRNLLILAGTRSRLEGLMELVMTFDVDVLKGMSFGLFRLQHVSVKDVDEALKVLMDSAGAAPARGEAQDGVVALDTGVQALGALGSVMRVVAIERLNALLIVSSRAYYVDQAREWIEKLDQPYGEGAEPQLFVYPVQNGTAGHLANLLNTLFGIGTAAARVDAGVAPELEPAALGTTAGRSGATGTAAQGTTPPALAQVRLAGDVRVVADEFSNALLIHAPRSEYRKIEAVLRRLDVTPTQVLIEASILEVTLADDFRFGLQWFFKNNLGGGLTGRGLLNTSVSGPIGAAQPGFSYAVTDRSGQIRAVLNALAQKSLLNVISSPSVLVVDNHNAQIHIGDQQPVQTATVVGEGGNVITTSIQFKDTGVMLNVTPSVNAGGLVSMVVNQRVTDVGAVDDATRQRSFLQREIVSRVAVRSGETVVLGGLIRDNSTTGKTGVPVLYDIPALGPLFGRLSRNNSRTELIVLLTPQVLQDDSDVRAISEEMRRRLSTTFAALPGWTTEGPLNVKQPYEPALQPDAIESPSPD